jgi:hypothetical protein
MPPCGEVGVDPQRRGPDRLRWEAGREGRGPWQISGLRIIPDNSKSLLSTFSWQRVRVEVRECSHTDAQYLHASTVRCLARSPRLAADVLMIQVRHGRPRRNGVNGEWGHSEPALEHWHTEGALD